MEITKIFFDMDGVLADFDRGVAEICKLVPGGQDEVPVEEEERMWAAIKEAGHFYARLELIPGALELFRAVYAKYGDKCEIWQQQRLTCRSGQRPERLTAWQ